MIFILFTLLAICVVLAFFSYRKLSIYLFIATLVLAALWFGHHVTSHLAIQL